MARGGRGLAIAMYGSFGVLMVAAGVFSARSWEVRASFDRVEDLLHSVAATAMGFVFAFGVLAVSDLAGVVQRSMFAIACLWYLAESFDRRGPGWR